MVTNLEEYRRKKQLVSKVEMVEIPVYERVYLDGNKLIGEAPDGQKDIITDYDEES